MQPDEEDVDIDRELRRYLTDACARLDATDHYAILGVPREADVREIKRAYLRLAGLLHPDRFFRKRLGSYKAGLQRLFTQVTVAHDTLTSRERRAAYDATLGAPRAPGGAREPSPVPPPYRAAGPPGGPQPDARQAAMDALGARFRDAKAKAGRHAEAGARARAAGDLVGAAEAYRAALQLSPGDGALKATLRELEGATAARVVESRRKQAALEERYGHWAAAASSWQRVLEAAPADEEATRRLAAALERSRTPGR